MCVCVRDLSGLQYDHRVRWQTVRQRWRARLTPRPRTCATTVSLSTLVSKQVERSDTTDIIHNKRPRLLLIDCPSHVHANTWGFDTPSSLPQARTSGKHLEFTQQECRIAEGEGGGVKNWVNAQSSHRDNAVSSTSLAHANQKPIATAPYLTLPPPHKKGSRFI